MADSERRTDIQQIEDGERKGLQTVLIATAMNAVAAIAVLLIT